MIGASVFAGSMMYLSGVFSWLNLPQLVKRFTINHPLVTDFGFAGIVMLFVAYTKSATIALASIVAGVMCGATLQVVRRHPELAGLEAHIKPDKNDTVVMRGLPTPSVDNSAWNSLEPIEIRTIGAPGRAVARPGFGRLARA